VAGILRRQNKASRHHDGFNAIFTFWTSRQRDGFVAVSERDGAKDGSRVSVAFRRESDEEHLEPRFERPLPPGPNYVTAHGPALIAARIAALEAELTAATEPQAEAIRRDLRYWATRRATAEVVAPPADGTAGIGTLVRVRLNGRTRTVAVVGDDEAEPGADRLAFSAPLARCLIGSGAGDILDFAGRSDALEILSVEPLP